VLSRPDSPRGKLLSQYVLARIVRLDRVDFGLFDWDRHNTLYYFALNADEQIYLRYGGRDWQSFQSYLDLESIELALEQGLELHGRYQAGELPKKPRPEPLRARDFPLLVERTVGSGACVECHLTMDYQNQHRELDGTLDPIRHLYRSPDIKAIGIHLDVPKGLVVREATDAVAFAGMQPGDRITHLNGTAIYTFADLQYHYDKLDRDADGLRMTVERGRKATELTVELPMRWWFTDLSYRQWSMEPRVPFRSQALTEAEKRELGLEPAGFASQVKGVDNFVTSGSHEIEEGDIIFSIDGRETDEVANTAELFIKLRIKAGETVRLSLLRGGEKVETELQTMRVSFRK